MSSTIFDSVGVKTLKSGGINFNNDAYILNGTDNPTVTPVSAPKGSLYQNTSTGNIYRKLDAGSTTNWLVLESGGTSALISNGTTKLDVNISGGINFNGDAYVINGTVDPTSSAVDAPEGSLYQNTSFGNLYIKKDSGSSTNWNQLVEYDPCYLSTYRATSDQNISANTDTDIIFNTVITDTKSGYNNTTGIYTVQDSGVYLITANLNVGSAASTTKITGYLFINSSFVVVQGTATAGNKSYTITLNHLFPLVLNDTVKVVAYYQSDAGTLQTYSTFTMIKIDG